MFIVLQLYTFVVGTGIEPVFQEWKSCVLTPRRTDHRFGISPFFLLKRLDLNQRSYLSNRLFTTIPICPHQSNANVMIVSPLVLFMFSCGRGTRTPDFKVMSLASYLCYTPRYSRCKDTNNFWNNQILLNLFFIFLVQIA